MLALRSFAAASLQRHSLGSAAALPTQTRTRPDCRPARLRSSQPTEAQPRVWCCPARADTHTGRAPFCAASQQPDDRGTASGLALPCPRRHALGPSAALRRFGAPSRLRHSLVADTPLPIQACIARPAAGQAWTPMWPAARLSRVKKTHRHRRLPVHCFPCSAVLASLRSVSRM